MTEPETPADALVIVQAQDIRLPELLRHIEAGKLVLVIEAKQEQDRS
jgi:nitrate reductase NapAB chaperone NapD